MTSGDLVGVDVENVLLVVDSVRMVCLVKQNGVRVVVDGNVHRASRCHFDANRGPAAPGEVVHDLLVEKVHLGVRLLLHAISSILICSGLVNSGPIICSRAAM